jgi:hypothetical protein
MPLPFAPPPSQSKVYADLKNITLNDLTSDQFDTLKEGVYAQGIDGAEDEYRRLLLLGGVADKISSSGPIPGTGAAVSVTDTTGSGSPVSMLLEPEEGEAYEVSGGEWKTKNCTAMYLRIYDGDGSTFVMIDYKTSVGILEITTGGNFKVVYPQTLRVMYGTSNGDNTIGIAYCRVR